MKFVEHRIADQRVVRHIRKWLNAGVLEDGKRTRPEDGVPQGGSVSPVLANVYLHYVFDLWADQWRRRQARGDVILVRYADDFVVGFQYRWEAERFLRELRERFAKFNLQLHPDKTRLIEFGRYASERRKARGQGKPATFNFLGFTHACSQTRKGWFALHRHPQKQRMRRKLQEVREALRQRMHDPIPEVGHWLGLVLAGWQRYYAVPGSYRELNWFRRQLERLWRRVLRRRSQKDHTTWSRMRRLSDGWLPRPRILHPYPSERLCVTT